VNLRVALELGRVSNLPTVWTNVLAGYCLAGGFERPDAAPRLAVLLPALSTFYVAGMWLNDALDARHDATARPDRPIPSGRAEASEVFAGAFAMLLVAWLAIVALAFAAPSAAQTVGLATLLVGLIVLYDARHRTSELSPIAMGLCRGGVYLVSASAASHLRWPVVAIAGAMTAYVTGLTFLARAESRGAGRRAWALPLLAVPLVAIDVGGAVGVGLAVLVGAWILRGARLVWKRDYRGGVGALVAGVSGLDALAMAHAGHATLGALCLAAVAATQLGQRFVRGT
jgi:hypothetical protein